MSRYILVYSPVDYDGKMIINGSGSTKIDFLSNVDEQILETSDWTVHEIKESTHKSYMIHSGEIDELTGDT